MRQPKPTACLLDFAHEGPNGERQQSQPSYGIVENSLDASQVAPFDIQLEAAGIAQSGAIRVGALMQDLHTQYHQTKPWLLLQEGSPYTSSAMPQKRNPGLIMGARMKSSDVVGLASSSVIRAHNVTTGMVNYKSQVVDLGVLTAAEAKASVRDFSALMVNKDRARAELDADWTSTMNLAEVLLKDYEVPFRVGHGLASLLVSYARPLDLTSSSIPLEAVKHTFAKALENIQDASANLSHE